MNNMNKTNKILSQLMLFHGRRDYSQRVILQWSAEAKILGYLVGETVGFR